IPLFQRGEPTGILLLWRSNPHYALSEAQLSIAEIYGYWLSIAIESFAMFEKVSLSQDEWENTFDSIADPIYIIDQFYRLKKINKSLAALTMKSIKLPPNRDCYRYLFNQSSICPWCPVPKSLETGQPETVEAALFSGGPWQIQSFRLEDKSEKRIGSIHVLRDMTLLKRMQEQLIESEKLASIGKLISGVAHEVRNPLFGISATVRALANELEGKQEIKPFVDIIMSETGRLNRLMEDLLNYSRPAQIDKNPSDLAEIIHEVMQHFKLVSGAQDVEIRFQETEKVPPINVDRNGIKQVLLNLFENGIQHRKGSLHVDVFLEFISLAAPPEIHLVVKDNGAGIGADVLPRVFDPFFTTRSKGTGLGLSIVRKVIHDHGGRISVESYLGVGTTFRITLPVTSSS
ncbi:MAG TPA: ATP-binding protein, partial [Acidobacteriota bacterium]